MAGLGAAARLRQLGHPARVLEKGNRPGGSMLWSSGVVWRHRTLEAFRDECPHGDPRLQELLVSTLDDALDWLEHIAGPALERTTGNPVTIGRRFDPTMLTSTLSRAAGPIVLSQPLETLPEEEVVLATGGFGVELARSRGLAVRAAPWSEGDGMRLAVERGAATAGNLDEFYGRALPAPPARVEPDNFVRAAQLYGRFAHVVDDAGRPVFADEPSWAETDLVQAVAQCRGGRAWYVVDADARDERVRDRSVDEMIDVAEELGAHVRRACTTDSLGLGPLESSKLAKPPFAAVNVAAAVTHTLGGLRIDDHARVLDARGSRVEGVFAAGVDVGGIGSGGYASGLASALVLGVTAAETIDGSS